VNYYKLETVKEILRTRHGAEQLSATSPRVEVWRRVVGGQDHRVFLRWEHGEEILSEREVRYAAEGLGVDAESFLEALRGAGGLWLGLLPPGAA
jgi:hypothetical protein